MCKLPQQIYRLYYIKDEILWRKLYSIMNKEIKKQFLTFFYI